MTTISPASIATSKQVVLATGAIQNKPLKSTLCAEKWESVVKQCTCSIFPALSSDLSFYSPPELLLAQDSYQSVTVCVSDKSKWTKSECTKLQWAELSANARKSKTDMWKKSWKSWERCHWLSEGRQVWALCEQPDRGRVVKGSILTLIIDKYEGDRGEREERERQRAVGVSACSSIFWVSKVKICG